MRIYPSFLHRYLFAGLVACLVPIGAARAVSLSDLVAGGSLNSGSLTYSAWSVTDFSDVALNLDPIEVTPLSDSGDPGLLIETFFVTSGDIIELLFDFTVTTTLGTTLVGSALELGSRTLSGGSILELRADVGGEALLVNDLSSTDSVVLANPQSIAAFSELVLDDSGSLEAFRWRFAVVPEPGTAQLLLLGLLLGPFRNRRRSST